MTSELNHNFVSLNQLLLHFAADVETAAQQPAETIAAIQTINPQYLPRIYSEDTKANLLANVVAGIYAPVIHSYTTTVLHNIAAGRLPADILLPPRDTIPMVYSLHEQAKLAGIHVRIHTPGINRITAGIANNQADYTPKQDPLFDELLIQHFADLQGPLLELETGIYGTTTLALAEGLQRKGITQPVVPFKLYGLGPSLSYVHALLSGGETWCADAASEQLTEQVLSCMVFVDSIEEFGMQNRYASIPSLYKDSSGYILPVLPELDSFTTEICQATNLAIVDTAAQYKNGNAQQVALSILQNFESVVYFSRSGIPLSLQAAVPPMDNKSEHFAKLSQAISAGIILHPQLSF